MQKRKEEKKRALNGFNGFKALKEKTLTSLLSLTSQQPCPYATAFVKKEMGYEVSFSS